MKLYFYFLDSINNGISMEECEAEEKQKTYRITGNLPEGYYNRTVNKSEMGRLRGIFLDGIVLTEKNPERAAEALTLVCEDDIRRAESTIRGEQEKIRKIQKTIENIEKWRSENAGK